MDISTLLSVVHTLFVALNCSELKEVCSMWNYESKLDEFIKVVVTVKNVLLDAEAKYIFDQLPRVTQQYIEELSLALYDADDLIDEFVTLAKQRHLLQARKFNKKVGHFFSHNDPLGVACNISQGISKIKTELDLLQATTGKFGLKGLKRDETCSYPDTEIIGRDDDVEEIVDKLLHYNVSALTIVGMGGMGKTALVQLVFNHEKIISEFSLRLWTCVSDHDQSNLNVKAILSQILESASGQKSNECSMELVVNRVRGVLLGKRFLIVLDDLWTESRHELQKLLGHLDGGKIGSRIVVSTRSKKTANIMGESVKYELQGLSYVYSWDLFRVTAFDMKDHESPKGSYIDKLIIGKDIIKKCVNVPLAIRVIGGLLYREDISKWREVQKFELANLSEHENGITPILKLSYYNLESPLRSCFSYCSLYPKNFRISKETVIRLWIAQGYVVPRGNDQRVEDAGEEYFLVLLRRCFFQDVKKDGFGRIISFKLHALMHDVALEVSKKEICPASPCTREMDKAVRHVSLTKEQYANFGLINVHIRTYLPVDTRNNCVDTVLLLACLVNYRRLRTLDLSYLYIKTFPALIGKFIHLRYLNLSGNEMEVLPNSITEIYNLQTLDLNNCIKLKELPNNFCNLVNLRVIWLYGCNDLAFMPSGMSNLRNLYELSMFVVGLERSSLKQHAELEGLKALKMLSGDILIVIHFPNSGLFTKDNTISEGNYIKDKEHLNSIYFECKREETKGGSVYEEELMGALQPHGNLKHLSLSGYQGDRMPRWAIEENLTSLLPNLVRFELSDCCELECLPSLRKLQYLKYLTLINLVKLEYVESPPEIVLVHGEESGGCLQFFPCLEELTLCKLPKLKEWRRNIHNSSSGHQPDQSSPVFFQLMCLDISSCPNLGSIPLCPNVKTLCLSDFNERLQITSNLTSCLQLKKVTIDNMSWLQYSLPRECFQSLTELRLWNNTEVECLSDFGRVIEACSSTLRSLEIWNCSNLRSVSGGLCSQNALERLVLAELPKVNLDIEGDVKCDGMSLEGLYHTLQHLDVLGCKGSGRLIPQWIHKLRCPTHVALCSMEWYESCQNPKEEDLANILRICRFRFKKNPGRHRTTLDRLTAVVCHLELMHELSINQPT